MTNAATLDAAILEKSLTILFDSLTCLGVTCDQIGFQVQTDIVIDSLDCTDLPMNTELAGYQGSYDRMFQVGVN